MTIAELHVSDVRLKTASQLPSDSLC